jgi:hypothetical protein
MASEEIPQTEKYSQSDKLAVALACLAGFMAVVLFLIEKTPLMVAGSLMLMVALCIYPILHFARSIGVRIALMVLALLITGAIGRFAWPKGKIIIVSSPVVLNANSDALPTAKLKSEPPKPADSRSKTKIKKPAAPKIDKQNDNSGSVVGNITPGPCSNVQVGGSNNVAIGGNCGPPEPNITWSTQDELSAEKTITWISLKVDHPMDLPAFAATCDRPCKSLGASLEGYSHAADLKINKPNMTGIVLLAPRPLGQGLQVHWPVQSLDGGYVKIIEVRRLLESELPAEFR